MKIDSSKHGVVVDTLTDPSLNSDLGPGANKHGLVVSNLINVNDEHFINKLKALQQQGIELSLLHVIANVPSYYYQIPSFQQIMHAWDLEAHAQLSNLAKALNIPEENCWLARGHLEDQISRCVSQHQLDFVISKAPMKKGLFANLVSHIPHAVHHSHIERTVIC